MDGAHCVNWPDLTRVHGEETVEEDKNTNQGGRDQHAGVPAQPRKVKADFLSEVTSEGETGSKSCSLKRSMFLLLQLWV